MFKLNQIEDWIEWDDGITNSIMTSFPCLNLQQSLNTLAVRFRKCTVVLDSSRIDTLLVMPL
jgi:hypothetical protein